jgi:hypothetical protein
MMSAVNSNVQEHPPIQHIYMRCYILCIWKSKYYHNHKSEAECVRARARSLSLGFRIRE